MSESCKTDNGNGMSFDRGMTRKRLAAQLASEASARAKKDMQEAFATFELNPDLLVYKRTVETMKAFQSARYYERIIAEWEDI